MTYPIEHATVIDGYVPVVDLSAAVDPAGRAGVAQMIGTACETSGFFTVVGHGVDRALIDRIYATSRAFFEQSAEEKAKVGVGTGTHGFYVSAGSAAKSIGQEAPPDLNEVFITCVRGDDSLEERAPLGDDTPVWAAANRWPDTPGFREAWAEYTTAMERLAADLIRLFALALGLDEHFFDDKVDHDMSTIAANYYYPLTTPPLPGQLRKGPHTDWGNLTILYQDEVGGLQVQQRGHGWREVPCVPGSFVINIGDLMAFWTGGRWVSTLHRVRNPTEGSAEARISIPFFHMPNHDALIEPLFPFADAATQARFQPTTTPGTWYQERLAATLS
ncbi:isopenicillin N synthase family oxygenase [Streptacidiphilus sp. P02-A3a]|uniref:isopenicillin N synthase family dioxygenase n=1 Tax=Streptacidiphilus sp. P02-A3a TaxID=2704468 RepID=UPI001CDC1227|nr:2OG-Fe(II) oxygenase family protein [Streptacidiphilus sp. P02-A3a]QMU67355.1 isopenicillin N synthase family oxygenase [Streptacidiphilus sp. P02-A3a]